MNMFYIRFKERNVSTVAQVVECYYQKVGGSIPGSRCKLLLCPWAKTGRVKNGALCTGQLTAPTTQQRIANEDVWSP